MIGILTFFLTACNLPLTPTPGNKPIKPSIPTEGAPAQPPGGIDAGNMTYLVTNPNSGAELYAAVFYPETWDGESKLPALVLVPGGSGDSGSFLRRNQSGASTVTTVNDAGYIALIFDPDGRGSSQGAEDYNGFTQQDGLAEVILSASTWPGVDPDNIGLATFSYGITMGAGALARYPHLPVKFLIDWEGPANRDDTGGCDASELGHLKEVAYCDDESFWKEREASTFISEIEVPYQRLQSENDHVQPDNFHAILMVNNAVNGGAPWVRLNRDTPNKTYTPENSPAMIPERMDRQVDTLVVEHARELFER